MTITFLLEPFLYLLEYRSDGSVWDRYIMLGIEQFVVEVSSVNEERYLPVARVGCQINEICRNLTRVRPLRHSKTRVFDDQRQ